MSNDLLQIHVLIEVRRCGSCLVLHIKHPSIPKPLWHKLTEPMYCPFPSTFRRCIFVRQVELAPGRFVLPSGHARTQPARAFPAQTVKTGWTLLSTGSVVVLVLQALIQRFLPGFFMNRAVRKAGQRLKRKEPAPARPLEEEYIKDFINSPQGEALSTPSFLVVSGSQGIGKSTMLNNLLSEHVKNGKRVLPLKMSSRPGEDLKLNEALPKALQVVNLPRYYPEQVEYMLEKVNETCKRRTGSAVVVYLQLTTKSRGDKFSRDACDDIASTHGAFARNITYDNAACKFIFWRSACLLWPTSSPKGLTCQGWLWCDHYLSKTSHLWSRRWQSRETSSGRWTRFLPKMTWTRCWSTTTSAWGATSAPWTWYWKTSPEKVRKVRMRSSSGLSSGTTGGWNQLKRNWMTRKWRTISSRWLRQDPWGISQTASRRPKWLWIFFVRSQQTASWGVQPVKLWLWSIGISSPSSLKRMSRSWGMQDTCELRRWKKTVALEMFCGWVIQE